MRAWWCGTNNTDGTASPPPARAPTHCSMRSSAVGAGAGTRVGRNVVDGRGVGSRLGAGDSDALGGAVGARRVTTSFEKYALPFPWCGRRGACVGAPVVVAAGAVDGAAVAGSLASSTSGVCDGVGAPGEAVGATLSTTSDETTVAPADARTPTAPDANVVSATDGTRAPSK